MVAGGRLSGSCVKVLGVLNSCSSELSQSQIICRTGLSERTVKYALKELVIAEAVSEFLVTADLRRKLYAGRLEKCH
ncbi:hypothetical protein HYU12_04925 [Candidatus Woesearchaeota archaeon]|nr:hypothetical protein [Candidatus Woesearchaeota archaeon]